MHPNANEIAAVLQRIEDEIIFVGTLLDTHPPEGIDAHVAAMDRALRNSYEAAESTARYLCLLRDPKPDAYAPVEIIRGMSAQHPAAYTRKDAVEAMRLCHGDAEQVAESVRVLVDNAELGEDATLRCEVATGEGVPRIVFTLDAPADFPNTLNIGASYDLILEDFGRRWTAASGGGHVAKSPQTLILFLEGGHEIPTAPESFNRAAPVAKKLARSLRSWRGAIGHYEPGYASGEDIIKMYRESLARTHGHVRELREVLGLR